MEAFPEKVRRYGRQHGLWQRGDRILAAVSGGPDSLALLLTLTALAGEEGFSLVCCTVNHHLRAGAEQETAFVAEVSKALGVDCVVESADVPAWRAAHGESVETAARILRYEALRRAARQAGCGKIAAAHHRDDQAETVLYHFLRGSGTAGLAGMRPLSGDIIRPFLGVSRKEIEAFLAASPWTPCHDETNDEPRAMRNRLRLLLLPELGRYNPRMAETLCRTAEIMAADDDFLEVETEKWERKLTRDGAVLAADRTLFADMPAALARRLLRRIGRRCGGQTPDFEETERLLAFLREGASGKWTSAAGMAVRLSGSRALFYQGSTRAGTALPGQRVSWELVQTLTREKPAALGANELLLDADAVGEVALRFPRPGDVFAPSGRTGTKKLFPYMNELGIPAEERPAWPLAADESCVYWIGGKKSSRYGRPGANTKNYLLLTLRRKDDGTPDEGH